MEKIPCSKCGKPISANGLKVHEMYCKGSDTKKSGTISENPISTDAKVVSDHAVDSSQVDVSGEIQSKAVSKGSMKEAYMEKKEEIDSKKEKESEKDSYICGKCNGKMPEKYPRCPHCGVELGW